MMIVDRPHNNQPDLQTVEEYKIVNNFNHLGCIITTVGYCETKIRHSLSIAKNTTTRLTNILRYTSIIRNIKLQIVNTLISPIVTNSSERLGKSKENTFRM